MSTVCFDTMRPVIFLAELPLALEAISGFTLAALVLTL
jgi:hypothetical protein